MLGLQLDVICGFHILSTLELARNDTYSLIERYQLLALDLRERRDSLQFALLAVSDSCQSNTRFGDREAFGKL
jgi:hypothetical protein